MIKGGVKMTSSSQHMMLANHVPGPAQGQWTYSHYAALPADEKRYEIVDGVLYMSPPSPSEWHQKSAIRCSHYLFTHIELTGLGHVYAAPFDVELAPGTVVQSDIIVLLQQSSYKITSSHITGAPDLIVEIASPSTADYDRQIKYAAYARVGVKEYWIADPQRQTVEVFTLEAETYHSLGVFQGEATLQSLVVPDFPVRIEQLFN